MSNAHPRAENTAQRRAESGAQSRAERRARARTIVAPLALLASGLLGCVEDPCSVDEQKSSVLEIMRDVYFYNGFDGQSEKYDAVDLGSEPDVLALLDTLRYDPLDVFTRVTTPSAERLRFGRGQFVGFGVGLSRPSENELFVSRVYEGSPAEEAMLSRGDEILAIDGRLLVDFADSLEIDRALGPAEFGLTVELLVRPVDPIEPDRLVVLTKRRVSLGPVGEPTVFETASGPVGYLPFFTFIEAAEPALVEAAIGFTEAGVDTVIVDLRYNGGGDLLTAARAIDLFGSDGQAVGPGGDVMFTERYDVDDPSRVRQWRFAGLPDALAVDTLVFITTEATASASELLINALDPYRDVYVVGSTTFGKPVGQNAFDYCDGEYRLRADTFDLVNADGFGEYYDGLAPDCEADDDLFHPLGDVDEASIATALTVAETGACPVPAAAAARVGDAPDPRTLLLPGTDPWVGVY